MKRALQLIKVLFVAFISTESNAATIHLKPGNSIGKDAYLASSSPNSNFSTHDEFSGAGWTCGSSPCNGRGLLSFDLSAIPANAFIQSASMSLFAHPNPANGNGIAMQGNNTATLQRITGTWNESTVTWNSIPASTSMNQVTLNQSTSQYQDYQNIDVTLLVQDMTNDPSNSYGFLLKLVNEVSYTTMTFASSDYTDSLLWPEITIEYYSTTCLNMVIDANHGADAFLASSSATTNFGNHQELGAEAWTCSSNPCYGRGIFTFDLSSIPTSVVIVTATLDLYANPSPANGNGTAMQGNNDAIIQRVTGAWTESGVTWASAPNLSTQNQVQLPASTSAFQDYLNINVTGLVQDMLANPSSSYGFHLSLLNESGLTTMIFASSDYPDSTKHPALKVCYKSNVGVEEIVKSIDNISIAPNPFTEDIALSFNLDKTSKVNVEIYDVVGRQIAKSNLGSLQTGNHSVQLKDLFEKAKSGLYTLRISCNDYIVNKKLIKN